MADDGGPAVGPAGVLLRGGSYKAIHPQHFRDRLVELYSYWQQHNVEKFAESNVLIIETPQKHDNLRSSVSSIFHIWLFGVEFPETIIVFSMRRIDFICKRSGDTYLFDVLRDAMDGLEKEMYTCTMGTGHGGIPEINYVFRQTRDQLQAIRVGCTREWDGGHDSLFFNWYTQMRPTYLHYANVTNGFLQLFTLKNAIERANIRRSANLNHAVMDRYVVGIIRFLVQNQFHSTNSEISNAIQRIILDSRRVNESRHERVDICYPPVVQSGEEFDLRPFAVSNDNIFFHGAGSVIICAIGSSYDDYCSCLARTYLISPTTRKKVAYEILLKAQRYAIQALRPGIEVSRVYEKARRMVQLHDRELLPHLTSSAGSGIGINLYESILDVNPDNDTIVRTGMVFNITIGFNDVTDAGKSFSMLLGDTVIVEDNGPCVITRSDKSFDYVKIM